jgi:hypothetical protein
MLKYCAFCEANHPFTKIHWYIDKRWPSTGACKVQRLARNRKNKATINAYQRTRNRECYREAKKKNDARSYALHRDKRLAISKRWAKANVDLLKRYNANYYLKNRESLLTKVRQWRQVNRVKARSAATLRKRQRWKDDINYRLKECLRHRLWLALKGETSGRSLRKLVGCSIEALKVHLGSQFKSGMSFANYGEWHVDHIKPLSAFDLRIDAELLRAAHFSNLQPLWAAENFKKSNRTGEMVRTDKKGLRDISDIPEPGSTSA